MSSLTVITGASRGLGRALALKLAEPGARLVLIARNEAALAEVATEVRHRGAHAIVEALDVADCERAAQRLRRLDAEHGGFDRVIANAGVGPRLDVPAYAWEALRGPCHVNFCGAAATLTAALPAMVDRGRGHLVGIGSLSSFGALPGAGAYSAPKAGLSMLLECLRLEVAPLGVAVTTVFAGFIDTAMVAHRRQAMPQRLSVDDAAARIVRALPARPARIDFPQPLAWAARAGACLPRALRDPVVRRLAK